MAHFEKGTLVNIMHWSLGFLLLEWGFSKHHETVAGLSGTPWGPENNLIHLFFKYNLKYGWKDLRKKIKNNYKNSELTIIAEVSQHSR